MDKKKLTRVIMTWLVTAVMLFVFLADIGVNLYGNYLVSKIQITPHDFDNPSGDDKIHFLNTGNSDCIIIESNGKFALIDSGEGDENPRRKTEYAGFSQEVLSYINSVCKNDEGKIHFDFILVTHIHYDHAGNFEKIIKNENISIDKAFIKKYDGSFASETDSEKWGNKKLYENIISALNENKIPIIDNIPDKSFSFGDFTIQFINTATDTKYKKAGENANSVGVILEKSGKKAFLAADFVSDDGFDLSFGEKIGDVDLLKIGHHGYFGSSGQAFLKKIKPEIAICTNYLGKIYPNVKWNLTVVAKVPVFSTAHRNGIIATFTDSGDIKLTSDTGGQDSGVSGQ